MKKILFLLATQLLVINLWSQEAAIKEANEAYSNEEYGKAAELYQAVLQEHGESANIYYNLGNCYYKMNRIAPAILNYERALLLDPGNSNIRFNLEMSYLKTVDKIETVGHFFVEDWATAIRNLYATNQWSYIGIVCFLLFIICLVLFFFSRKIILKKVGFYAGIALLILTITSNTFSYKQKEKLVTRNTAIVFAPTVTIKSSPSASGNDLFLLHEGTKVTIKTRLGSWYEMETADGHIGWISEEDIEVI